MLLWGSPGFSSPNAAFLPWNWAVLLPACGDWLENLRKSGRCRQRYLAYVNKHVESEHPPYPPPPPPGWRPRNPPFKTIGRDCFDIWPSAAMASEKLNKLRSLAQSTAPKDSAVPDYPLWTTDLSAFRWDANPSGIRCSSLYNCSEGKDWLLLSTLECRMNKYD